MVITRPAHQNNNNMMPGAFTQTHTLHTKEYHYALTGVHKKKC